jgi:hypothetical protein
MKSFWQKVSALALCMVATSAPTAFAGGGLMQLVAYGAQDVYLTGNSLIPFFEVLCFCSDDSGIHDSTESVTVIPDEQKKAVVVELTNAKNGHSIPYALIRNPNTPPFSSLDIDAKGVNKGSFAIVAVTNNDNFLDFIEWDFRDKQKTSALPTTPTGFTHYKLMRSNSNTTVSDSSSDTPVKFQYASIGEFPSYPSNMLAIANPLIGIIFVHGYNSNVALVLKPPTSTCNYVPSP